MKAFIFPGQGSQIIGMGKELYDNFKTAKYVLDEVNDALNFNLTKIMFEGPAEELTSTENAQPAIMAVSLAIVEILSKEFGFDITKHVSYVAGHSLGEYSALVSAGVFDIRTCADILKTRGKAMHSSTPFGVGAMVAVLGISDMVKINELIKASVVDGEVCVMANDNCLGQAVISGNIRSIDQVIENAKDFGAMKAVKLPVSGSFHSPLMQRASEIMAEKLSNIDLNNPNIPIISNVLAAPTSNKDEIKMLLVEQVVKSVRWRESMECLVNLGVTEVIEVGQGSTLTGLMKRINTDVNRINLANPSDIENFANNL